MKTNIKVVPTQMNLITLSDSIKKFKEAAEGKQVISVNDYAGMINLEPAFQRGSVWNKRYRRELITSLLFGFPLPSIIFKVADDETLQVFDGKQRLTTITMFLNDEFETSDYLLEGVKYEGQEINRKKMSELPKNLQRDIRQMSLQISKVNNMTDEQTAILFDRFNSNTTKMSKGEKDRAIQHGTEVYAELRAFSEGQIFISLFSETKQKRLNHEDILQRIVYVGFNEKIKNTNYKKYMAYEIKKMHIDTIKNFLNKLSIVMEEFPEEIKLINSTDDVKCWALLGALLTVEPKHIKNSKTQIVKLFEHIRTIKKHEVKEGNHGNGGQYQIALVELCVDEIKKIVRQAQDSKTPRSFTHVVRKETLEKPNLTCEICNCGVNKDNMHLDHIVPHSKGGKTVKENMAVLCRTCNLKKGNSYDSTSSLSDSTRL
jgi:hypothetical protein